MKKFLLSLLITSIVLLSTSKSNAHLDFLPCGFYIGGTGSMCWHSDQKFSSTTNGQETRSFDVGFGGSAVMGIRDNLWRLEIESLYRRNRLKTANSEQFDDSGPAIGYNSDLALMTNLFLDMPSIDGIVFYAGGGIGFSINQSQLKNVGDTSIPAPNLSRKTVFAWQVMGGIGYDIAPCATVYAGYRLFVTSKTDDKLLNVRSDKAPLTHSVDIGLRINL